MPDPVRPSPWRVLGFQPPPDPAELQQAAQHTGPPPPPVPLDDDWMSRSLRLAGGGVLQLGDLVRGLTVGTDDPNDTWAAKGGTLLAAGLPLTKLLGGKNVAAAAKVLERRWPALAAALETHQTPLQLPGRTPASALDRLASDIHTSTLSQGGATTYPLTGTTERIGDPGFLAGKYSNQSGQTLKVPLADFSPKTVRAFLEQHADAFAKDPTLALGTWTDGPDVYLDVSQKSSTQRAATMAATRQKQPPGTVRDLVTGGWPKAQEAVFDLQRGESLPVGNLQEFLSGPEFQQRLDEQYAAGVPVMSGKEWWNLYGGPLERVYGKRRVKPLAGFLASTSPASAPVHNLRAASEYLRRLIKGEAIIQPKFRIPETAVGWRPGSIGGITPGDFGRPGTRMPMEATRAPNLRRVAAGQYEQLQKDKVNDMFHALTGEDVGVYDRRFAKLAEKPEAGVFVDATKDKVPGSMGTTQVSPYALIENAVRDGAARHNMPLKRYSAYVWEGIGDTIKKTGQLYGTKHPAHSIPEASQGFGGIAEDMIAEKAKIWGVSVKEFERRLRRGDAELLTAILSTSAGLAAYSQWAQADPSTRSASGSRPPEP